MLDVDVVIMFNVWPLPMPIVFVELFLSFYLVRSNNLVWANKMPFNMAQTVFFSVFANVYNILAVGIWHLLSHMPGI